jgi:hypothetical protein
MPIKWCPSCRTHKSLTEFYAKKRGVPATTPEACAGHCRVCSNQRSLIADRKRRLAKVDPVTLDALITRLESRLARLYARQSMLNRTGGRDGGR